MIRIRWNNKAGRGEVVRDGGPVQTTDSLESAVLASLFTRASRRTPRAGQRRGGWWGDRLGPNPNDVWGSRFWLRGKTDETTRQLLEQDALDALAWMTRDGLARSIGVTAEVHDAGRFALLVKVERPDGSQWSKQWEATIGAA